MERTSLRIRGNGLVIRQFEQKDAVSLYTLVQTNQDHLKGYLPGILDTFRSLDQAKQTIERSATSEVCLLNAGVWSTFNQSPQLVGHIWLSRFGIYPEIAYWISSSDTRRGVGTLAVKNVCDWFAKFGNEPAIDAIIKSSNAASINLVEKCGFIEVGRDNDLDRVTYRRDTR